MSGNFLPMQIKPDIVTEKPNVMVSSTNHDKFRLLSSVILRQAQNDKSNILFCSRYIGKFKRISELNYSPLLVSLFAFVRVLNKAWQSLKNWCDPAMEGDPYMLERDYKSYRTNRSNWSYFSRRYLIQRP